jgi:DNA-directed RNA polymerase sigma subunit (sigma70/sigma32)
VSLRATPATDRLPIARASRRSISVIVRGCYQTSLDDDIIRLRWGLTDGYDYSLEQVAEKIGMAPERVAEIKARAEAKLRLTAPQAWTGLMARSATIGVE